MGKTERNYKNLILCKFPNIPFNKYFILILRTYIYMYLINIILL